MHDKKKAFLFDLDGVLIDSESIYTGIWNRINEKFPTGVENFSSVIKGCTLEDILTTYFSEEVRSDVEKMLYELEAKIQYQLTPGASELLNYLRAAGYPTALVTSSNDLKMRHLFSQLPYLKDCFNYIVTGDMVSQSKPNPEGYALAASTLGVSQKDCVVVEDSLQGVRAGEALGGKVIGISGTLPAEIIAPHSDYVFNSLRQLSPTFIETL